MKFVLIVMVFSSVLFAQPTKEAVNGGSYIINQPVTFGGNNFLVLTSNKDTASDPVVTEVSSIRAAMFTSLEFKAITSDSNNSSIRIEFQSRTCTNPTLGTGCPTQWQSHRFRRVYDTAHFYDTFNIDKVPQETTQVSLTTQIPTGNQYRFKVTSGSGDASYLKFIKLLGI